MSTLPSEISVSVPLATNAAGAILVGGSRVPLDTVIGAFNDGETPEQIVMQYDVLKLDDVYAVITYYLRHKEEVDAYLARREEQAEEIRKRDLARYDQRGIRERLLARRAAKQQ
jgi:uncharacterized protein (DUF433 family)